MTTSKPHGLVQHLNAPSWGTARAAESTLESGYTFRFPQLQSQSSCASGVRLPGPPLRLHFAARPDRKRTNELPDLYLHVPLQAGSRRGHASPWGGRSQPSFPEFGNRSCGEVRFRGGTAGSACRPSPTPIGRIQYHWRLGNLHGRRTCGRERFVLMELFAKRLRERARQLNRGDDLALELIAGLLEGTDGCHVVSLWLFEPATIAASMAIDRPQAIDAASVGAGARRGMAAARLCWLARNGRSRGPRACGVASPGEESLAATIAARRSRLAVLWPDYAIKRPREVECQTAFQVEDVADMDPCKRLGCKGEGTETLANTKAIPAIRDQGQR